MKKKQYWTVGIIITLIIFLLVINVVISNFRSESTECFKGKLLFDDIISNPNKYNNQNITAIATLENYSSMNSGGNYLWGSFYIFNFKGYKQSIELEFLTGEGNFGGSIAKGPGWICNTISECEDSIRNGTESNKDCDCYQYDNQTWKCDCGIRTYSWNFHDSGFEEGAYEITWSSGISEKHFIKSSDVGRTLKLELLIRDSEIYLNRYEFFNCSYS